MLTIFVGSTAGGLASGLLLTIAVVVREQATLQRRGHQWHQAASPGVGSGFRTPDRLGESIWRDAPTGSLSAGYGQLVELQLIVDRYAESLSYVDSTTTIVGTSRNAGKILYQPGIQPMVEEVVLPLLDAAWEILHPAERPVHLTELPYPTSEVPASTKLDHIISSDEFVATSAGVIGESEWGIEVKRLQFVGDNGKNGDHEVAKVLSPYLKDRGMLHDALRLLKYGFTKRIAVIGYGFEYDMHTLAHASTLHTVDPAKQTVKNIARIINSNGPLYNRPLIEFADAILRMRGWTIGPRAEAEFEAWKHPAGGTGIVFGWEIRRPHLEPDYDPRHPW